MPADVAQERDQAQIIQPVGVVHHQGIGRAVAENQKTRKDAPDAGHIARDLVVTQELPAFILAGWIADFGGAATHQHDRLVAGLLQVPQKHDRHQTSHM